MILEEMKIYFNNINENEQNYSDQIQIWTD